MWGGDTCVRSASSVAVHRLLSSLPDLSHSTAQHSTAGYGGRQEGGGATRVCATHLVPRYAARLGAGAGAGAARIACGAGGGLTRALGAVLARCRRGGPPRGCCTWPWVRWLGARQRRFGVRVVRGKLVAVPRTCSRVRGPAVAAHGPRGAHAPGGRVRRRRRVSHSKGCGGRACRGLLGHLPGPCLAADCATGRRVSTSL
jgi:hypothetical protein